MRASRQGRFWFALSVVLCGVLLLATATGQSPGFGRAGAAPAGSDQVIAVGVYASLTLDNALAFIEAFEFVLGQVGYAYSFTDAERLELVHAVAASYPSAEQVDQLVLASARDIWLRVQANWPIASQEDRIEFALGVLVLAFGEETVAAWVGTGANGSGATSAGGGQCASFEECAGSFVDQGTWNDTFNTQGCWAAAGCSSYDPSTGSFDYGDY